MHKPFYASGFLYHSPSQQILLQQLNSDDLKLGLFSASCRNGNSPLNVFQDCVEKALDIAVPDSSIHPVYDYVLENLGEQFIFFAEVVRVGPIAPKNKTQWVLLSKLSKFRMSEQTRHDIIIGERVIKSRMEPAHVPQYPHL